MKLRNFFLIALVFLFSASEANATQIGPRIKVKTQKHRYCVIAPVGSNQVECRDCWSRLGGEGGRADCGARVGPGSVNYGFCNEQSSCPQ